jgi:hypothetical protein
MKPQLPAQPIRLKIVPLGGLLKRCFDVLWVEPILKTIPVVCALRGSY